jgi:biotin transport system substrate-specific component
MRTLIIPAALVVFFAAFTAVTARIVVPLPFTPVPVTLQTLAVILSGMVLGSRGGAAAQLAYLSAILAGAPLTAAGLGGPGAFLAPTAGYLIAFVPAAFAAGWVVERLPQAGTVRGLLGYALAGLLGAGVIYVGGTSWLAVVLGSPVRAIELGVLPFVVADLFKVLAAALVAGGGRSLLEQIRRAG